MNSLFSEVFETVLIPRPAVRAIYPEPKYFAQKHKEHVESGFFVLVTDSLTDGNSLVVSAVLGKYVGAIQFGGGRQNLKFPLVNFLRSSDFGGGRLPPLSDTTGAPSIQKNWCGSH